MGLACQLSLPLHTSPAPYLELPSSHINSPRHQGPSLTPLNLAPSSMMLKPLTPPVITLATPLWCSLSSYKRQWAPPALTAPFPLSPELPRAFLHPHVELKPLPFVASVTPPLHHRPSPGEAWTEIPVFPSLYCALAGELLCSGVAGGQDPAGAPPHFGALWSTPPPVHDGPRDPATVHHVWTRSTGFFPCKIIHYFR
jgi:hypothetical protein